MNKIKVEHEKLYLKNEDVFKKEVSKDLSIYISGKVYLEVERILNQVHLDIYLEKMSELLFEFLGNLENNRNSITIYSSDGSICQFNFACTYSKDNELVLENYMQESNSENRIRVRAVEKSGNLVIKSTGIIEKETCDNVFLEDIKAIVSQNNSIKIMPDLIVKTNRVIANHNAVISNVPDLEVFYLMSKGISKENAHSLIKEGFLKSIFQNKDKD